ncbi:MAG TPA: hypothetical protein IAB73_08160 [Candidatus Onthenecus intestinigallinarum]|uniref:Uncharacterized protein n=1 Tax=Candidatus Onthenecus intestinigallinarum TaxID=2840875 RepID=A0A9D0ZCY1_9FIRM|nr:hypothetical protein [Candidatus Onthenecus intestinigallinarum]
MSEHKPHTGFKIAAGIMDFFGVAAASLVIVILMLMLSSLYTWLRQDLQTTFAGISKNITEAVVVDATDNR